MRYGTLIPANGVSPWPRSLFHIFGGFEKSANFYEMFKPVNDNKTQTKALVLVLLIYQNGVQLPAVPPSICCIYIVYFLFSAQFFSIYKVYFYFLLIALPFHRSCTGQLASREPHASPTFT